MQFHVHSKKYRIEEQQLNHDDQDSVKFREKEKGFKQVVLHIEPNIVKYLKMINYMRLHDIQTPIFRRNKTKVGLVCSTNFLEKCTKANDIFCLYS